MRCLCLLILFSFSVSCDSDKKKSVNEISSKKVYDLYEPSEMAILMNKMYAIQENIKNDILEESTLSNFPEEIFNIHTAQLSDFKNRNENFKAFSHLFVERVEFLFDETSEISLKQRYNNVVNLCISCHQTECTGPIPRIQKLLIK